MVYIDSLIKYCPTESYPVRLDIDNDIIKFNRKELDSKSRKNIAKDLRKMFPKKEYVYFFKEGIELKEDQKLIISFENIQFKNTYTNLRVYTKLFGLTDVIREGYRYLSNKEIQHIANLIDNESEHITFSMWCDLD